MTLKEQIKALLIKHEGLKLSAYEDSRGYITIGVGRMIDRWRHGGITKIEAEYLLNNDIIEVEHGLDTYLDWWRDKTENVQLVLMDMCFNLGIHGLLGFKKFLNALENDDFKTAQKEMLDSKWAGQVGKRAIDLKELLC